MTTGLRITVDIPAPAPNVHLPCTDYDAVLATPCIGVKLGIRIEGDAVSGIDFLSDQIAERRPCTAIGLATAEQLRRYFSDPTTLFTLHMSPNGTDFQRRVWDALRMLPSGTTNSYGELAHRLQTGPRAIGGACRANPIPILIPCHRIVSANGYGGFMGADRGPALEIKRWLLAHEKRA